MKISYLYLLLLAACGQGADNAGTTSDSGGGPGAHAAADPVVGFAESPPVQLQGCYEMTLKADTAHLQLQVADSVVTGNLVYQWASRDGNTGTIRGVLRDSLIVADYTFQSEGLTSVREVVFKIAGTTLVEAFGELETRKDRIVFRDPARLQFMEDNPFVKVACNSAQR